VSVHELTFRIINDNVLAFLIEAIEKLFSSLRVEVEQKDGIKLRFVFDEDAIQKVIWGCNQFLSKRLEG